MHHLVIGMLQNEAKSYPLEVCQKFGQYHTVCCISENHFERSVKSYSKDKLQCNVSILPKTMTGTLPRPWMRGERGQQRWGLWARPFYNAVVSSEETNEGKQTYK